MNLTEIELGLSIQVDGYLTFLSSSQPAVSRPPARDGIRLDGVRVHDAAGDPPLHHKGQNFLFNQSSFRWAIHIHPYRLQ